MAIIQKIESLKKFSISLLILTTVSMGMGKVDAAEKKWSLPAICYHQFGAEKDSQPYRISAERFEKQLAWLKAEGFRSVTLAQVQKAVDGQLPDNWPARPVLLTIDDGFRNAWTVAGPLLEKYGFTAVFFIVTDQVGISGTYLDWDEIRTIRRAGHDIGSHTRSHANLAKPKKGESPSAYRARIMDELEGSRRKLEKELGEPILSLAYPYGAYNRVVEGWVKQAGYRNAFSVTKGHSVTGQPRFRIRRNLLMGHPSEAAFARHLLSKPVDLDLDLEGRLFVSGHYETRWKGKALGVEADLVSAKLAGEPLELTGDENELAVNLPGDLKTGFKLLKLSARDGKNRYEEYHLFQVIPPEWAPHFELE